MPGVVEEYVRNQEVQEKVHADLYWDMRAAGFSPQEVSNWMDERVRENPNVTSIELSAIYDAQSMVAEYAGGRYEGIGADVYDHAQNERERTPNASVKEIYTRATDRLIEDIRVYDSAVREQQKAESPRVKIS